MKMKLFISAICLMATMTLSMQAAQVSKDTPKSEKKEKTQKECPSQRMIKDLNLSESQITQIKELKEKQIKTNQERRAQRKAQKENKAASCCPKDSTGRCNPKSEYREGLKRILSQEQYTKYLELKHDQPNQPQKKHKKNNNKK